MHKSTKGADFESCEFEGGATKEIRLQFKGTSAVGVVAKVKLDKGWQFVPHRHTDWLVITVLSGMLQVTQRNGQDVCLYEAGDTYLVEPGDLHTETALEDTCVVVITGPGVLQEKLTLRIVDI